MKKKPMQSISFKIWKIMVLTIGLFLLIVIIINATIIYSYKKDLYYNQLEDAAKAKIGSSFFDKKDRSNNYEFGEETILITHFGLFFEEDKKLFHIDSFTRSKYPGDEGMQLIELISDEIQPTTTNKDKSKIKINDTTYLYYVEWVEPNTQALVFFTPAMSDDKGFLIIFLWFLGMMVFSFLTSKIVASNIAKPIQELELFAEEVAKRNWDAKVPITDPDEIGLLAHSLENMRDSLKIAEERDREFLQSSSHDLKTPVMIIKGYAQALIDGVAIDSKTSAAHIIIKEAERLERRISQLLQLNSIGHTLENKTDRHIVRIDRVIKSLVNRCGVVAPHLTWNIDITPTEINGHAETLLIAFENLIDNQMRYASSVISIHMKRTRHELMITLHNDGPKFQIDDPMLLFDSYKKDLEGKFGLGLAIANQVIQSHHGTIIAFNTEDGVTFEITLPLTE